jgi:hypothetical protein
MLIVTEVFRHALKCICCGLYLVLKISIFIITAVRASNAIFSYPVTINKNNASTVLRTPKLALT